MAERELAAFTAAVNDLFGAEQARLAAEDWIRELVLAWEGGVTVRDLPQITIKAAPRFANRVNGSSQRANSYKLRAECLV